MWIQNGEASFILGIQEHLKLMALKAYQVHCFYNILKETVRVIGHGRFQRLHLDDVRHYFQLRPTARLHYDMKICLPSGQLVHSAVIGDPHHTQSRSPANR